MLEAIDFHGGSGTAELMEAVAILKALNQTGGRKVPDEAPIGFVPTRFSDYLDQAQERGDDTSYRHYWELCVPLGLRDGLRSGDVHVPGSRRYADPGTYLFTPEQWARCKVCSPRDYRSIGTRIALWAKRFGLAHREPPWSLTSVRRRPEARRSIGLMRN